MSQAPGLSSKAPCPCGGKAGGGKTYGQCCGPLHGGQPAPSAEALMRSRYSAYVLGLNDYVLATWHPDTRPADLSDDGETPRWLGLDVRRHQNTDADHAIVEFVARYRVQGKGHRLHETSRFVREAGRWYYVDGDHT